ncbi:subtilisin-like protein [Aaosphaeria arxii CBS 175.79]|uniref:Subtilisin-like protein n=1 Tax=Aaosphaeria arxii CBS 175.79 TaxID=1450172 RepID=A0A6A5Y066_9PLEO|nr:subtilisin-like protein [Aaosphaeria arxii CBS 175.79]KAF2018649.1 subtilisin-like protein [Aaosphaeria arxii CBS 175.79]
MARFSSSHKAGLVLLCLTFSLPVTQSLGVPFPHSGLSRHEPAVARSNSDPVEVVGQDDIPVKLYPRNQNADKHEKNYVSIKIFTELKYTKKGADRDKYLADLKKELPEFNADDDIYNEEKPRETILYAIKKPWKTDEERKEVVDEFVKEFNKEDKMIKKVEIVGHTGGVQVTSVTPRDVQEKRHIDDFKPPANPMQTWKNVRQSGITDSLAFFGWDKDKKLADYDLDKSPNKENMQYVHLSNPGRYKLQDIVNTAQGGAARAGAAEYSNVRLYLVDTGAHINHREFAHIDPKSWQWIHPGNAVDREKAEAEIKQVNFDAHGHGTCMLSKIIGLKHGTSKFGYPIIVKVPMYNDEQFHASFLSQAIVAVTRDWKRWLEKNAKEGMGKIKHAVVNMSFATEGMQNPSMTEDETQDVIEAMEEGQKLGLYYVVSTGNDGKEKLTSVPGILKFGTGKKDMPKFPDLEIPEVPLFLVGATDDEGQIWPKSNTEPNQQILFAPGVQVECANAKKLDNTIKTSGTSLSTASVSGLVMNKLSMPNDMLKSSIKDDFDQLHKHIYDAAWERTQTKKRTGVVVKGAFNGIDTPADLRSLYKVEYGREIGPGHQKLTWEPKAAR